MIIIIMTMIIIILNEKILYLKSYKNYTQNFSKIFIKSKRPYQYKFAAKPPGLSPFRIPINHVNL